MSCKTPVVLIVFRRPDLTRQVFDRIREAQPEKLFVIADGPRNPAETVLCTRTREVTEQVDWDCEVFRDYSDQNMGARHRISSGLDWVFEQVETAVILEDDCLPDPSFFSYCENLLEHYQGDGRVFSISGDNFQSGQKRGDGSYYFSHYFHGWGWATWRSAWRHYDNQMVEWPTFRGSGRLGELFPDPLEAGYWREFMGTIYQEGHASAWDYIWMLTGWMHQGLTLIPNVNLVANIGFGEEATNTTGKGSWKATRPAEAIGSLTHPVDVVRDREADRYTFDHVFPGNRLRRELCLKYRLRRWLWRMKQRLSGYPIVE